VNQRADSGEHDGPTKGAAAVDGLDTQTLDVAGGRVRVFTAGDGPAVLFVHGWPTHAYLWRHAMRALAPTHRVIALDLPASGGTEMPSDADLSLNGYTALLTEVVDTLGIERLGLCVHDAGGPIGLHWAARWSGKVDRLCLLNTIVFPEMSLTERAFFASARMPGASTLLGLPVGIRFAMRYGVSSAKLDDAVLEAYAAPFRDPARRHEFVHAIRSLDPAELAALPAALDRIADVPIALLYGERDRILPRVALTMQRLQERYPHATTTAWPDLGHFVQEDAPDRVADAIAAFFRQDAG